MCADDEDRKWAIFPNDHNFSGMTTLEQRGLEPSGDGKPLNPPTGGSIVSSVKPPPLSPTERAALATACIEWAKVAPRIIQKQAAMTRAAHLLGIEIKSEGE